MTTILSARCSIFLAIVSLLFRDVVGDCTAPGGECCNVCRNGGQITNPGKSFNMVDTLSGQSYPWTCGWLETVLADVNSGSTGAAGEARYCGLAQIWATRECECSGPPAPPDNNVFDINPACDLCGNIDGNARELNYVPGFLTDELVETGVAGRMPCGGLYHALSEGVLSSNLCPTVQRNAGAFCCSIPNLDDPPPANGGNNGGGNGGGGNNGGGNDSCIDLAGECDNGGECCLGFICRARGIGVPKVCSAVPRTGRLSVGRRGRGGAGGRAKYGG